MMLTNIVQCIMEKLDGGTVGQLFPDLRHDIDVGTLGLPTRALNVLTRESIHKTDELAALTTRHLLSLPNAGVGTVTAILMKVADVSIRGKQATPEPFPSNVTAPVSHDPDADVLDAIVLPEANDARLPLAVAYLLTFRERWFAWRNRADEHGVTSLLEAISSASWAAQATCEDPRLAHSPTILHQLHQDDSETHPLSSEADLLLDSINAGNVTARQMIAMTEWALEVLAWGQALPLSPLEIQAWLLVEAAARRRRHTKVEQVRIDALIQRFGLDGSTPITLQEGGNLCGFSRERMRQVQTKTLGALKTARVDGTLWLPALGAINSIYTGVPITFSDLSQRALAAGLSVADLTLNGLQEASKFIGVPALDGAGGLVGISDDEYKLALKVILREVRRYGLANLEDITRQLAENNEVYTEDLVRWIVDAVPELVWATDPATGTAMQDAWIGSLGVAAADIRLRNTAQSMLSVNSPLKVETILEGLRRRDTMRQEDRSIPLSAARAFFSLWPEFGYDLNTDTVQPTYPLAFEKVLADSAITMVKVLKQFPDEVGSRSDVMEAFIKAGIKSSTANIWLSFHEIIANYGWAVWGLVGVKPSPARVEAIQKSVRDQFEDNDMNLSWGADGNPAVTFTATKSFINTGTLAYNWPDYLRSAGAFDLVLQGVTTLSEADLLGETEGAPNLDDDSPDQQSTVPSYGTARFSTDHGFSWGWSPAIQASGVKRGDRVQVSFNITNRTARFVEN